MFIVLLATLLAILPFPNLPVLRHSLLLLFVLLVVFRCSGWSVRFLHEPLVALWVGFLFIFPLLTADASSTLVNMGRQWWPAGLALMATSLVGRMAVPGWRDEGLCLVLGLASAVPLMLHLGMVLFVWCGVLPASVGFWSGDGGPAQIQSAAPGSIEAFPWGYWGVHLHHADIGYAALQSVVLLMAAGRSMTGKARARLAIPLMLCLICPLISHSRAGVIFVLLAMFGLPAIWILSTYQSRQWKTLAGLAAVALVLAGGLLMFAGHTDGRWLGMVNRLAQGFSGDPQVLYCEGQEAYGARLKLERPELSPIDLADIQTKVANGDGTRVALARIGLDLVLEHPLGIDGSKQSFEKALRQRCAQPAILMAHSHNGWIDTALALGWLGGLLYFLLLGSFFLTGWRALSMDGRQNTWALVLAGLSLLWIARGVFDSVYRDHMLLMQALVLGFAYAQVRARLQS
ncbi:O-antigen ligase family protein [Dechloromonas sp. HYN0024]|uniref:O-antigen ligase family protein n=1 Tax=Dechloromonas sp. HYN0024 TaxID=2231055 RepID=UPI0013C2CC58|nr:O-antigen ligase family protein [Dechloromonas sp. HYN0024]